MAEYIQVEKKRYEFGYKAIANAYIEGTLHKQLLTDEFATVLSVFDGILAFLSFLFVSL